jgi:hypothetical protein
MNAWLYNLRERFFGCRYQAIATVRCSDYTQIEFPTATTGFLLPMTEVSHILNAIDAGDPAAAQLLP